MPTRDSLLEGLRALADAREAARLKRRYQTPEEVWGVSPPALKKNVDAWRRASGPVTPADLDGLFRSGVCEARLAAMDLALRESALWDKRWAGLFLRWARSEGTSWHVSDVLGPRLIGATWLSGLVEARQMVALSLWPGLWPWRAGLTALAPSLERDDSDWPLFEQFAKACLDEESRFHFQRQAFNGVRIVLRAALKSRPERVMNWLDRHEPTLPPYVAASLRAKTGAFTEEEA